MRALNMVLAALAFLVSAYIPVIAPAKIHRVAAPAVSGQTGVDMVCRSKELASDIAEVTVKTRGYQEGAATAMENKGECAILPSPYPATVESTKAVGTPFKDSDGDYVQIHLISFHVNGAQYWGVVIEILKRSDV